MLVALFGWLCVYIYVCVCHRSACVRACLCNYGWEGKGDKEIRDSSWTLVSLAASTHGTLLKCLDSQCPLAACPHSNSWKGLRQKNNHLEESPSGLALVPKKLLTGAQDVHFSRKTPAPSARHFKPHYVSQNSIFIFISSNKFKTHEKILGYSLRG